MRKQPKNAAERTVTLRLWTYDEANKALPYLRGVTQSLRDHWLDMQQAKQGIQRIDSRPGRPDRKALISRQEAVRSADIAESELEDDLRELQNLSIYSLDPGRGLALVPFRQGNELAWYVFDLFAPKGLESWRFHEDPVEMRRPLEQILDKQGKMVAAS